jgi:hypothetical protein
MTCILLPLNSIQNGCCSVLYFNLFITIDRPRTLHVLLFSVINEINYYRLNCLSMQVEDRIVLNYTIYFFHGLVTVLNFTFGQP